jgi:hypothetical protein
MQILMTSERAAKLGKYTRKQGYRVNHNMGWGALLINIFVVVPVLLSVLLGALFKSASKQHGTARLVQWLITGVATLWLSDRFIPVSKPTTWRSVLLWLLVLAMGVVCYLLIGWGMSIGSKIVAMSAKEKTELVAAVLAGPSVAPGATLTEDHRK